jgi:hypothetical protein
MAAMTVVVVSTLLSVCLQALLMRPRPAGVRLVLPPSAFASFPSGHAAAAFGCATLAGLLLRPALPSALLAAALVSLSRVYLGHHYPTHVIRVAVLGVATGAMAYGVSIQGFRRERPLWAWVLWPQVAVVLLATLCAYLGLLTSDLLALPYLDKALHLLLYGGLAFLAVGWWVRRPAGTVIAALALLAGVEEVLQSFSAVRDLDLGDLAGGLIAVALFGWLATVMRFNGTRPGAKQAESCQR